MPTLYRKPSPSSSCLRKPSLLVDTVANAKGLTARLASKSQELAVLPKEQQECEAERQRLFHDSKEAN